MRVLGTIPKDGAGHAGAAARRLSCGAFGVGVAVLLFGYVLLLAFHPGADSVSAYPEPVGDLLYRANFPGSRNAEAWTLAVHRAADVQNCRGRTGSYFREVPAARCRNLLSRLGPRASVPGNPASSCRYYYASAQSAERGKDVLFIQARDGCVLP